MWTRAMMFIRFLNDRRGSTVPFFALAALPLFGLIGASIDYSRASAARSALQSAADSTSLAMSKNAASLSHDQLQASASSYFSALFARPDAATPTVSVSYNTSGGSQVAVSATSSVRTLFMGVVGYSSMPIAATSTSTWGNTRMRVALVLDNTGSMAQSSKMTALKTASHNLLNQLQGAAVNQGDVYVSIIPFTKDVNVGASNVNASWIDWTDWNAANGSSSSSSSGTICYNGSLWNWNGSNLSYGGTCTGNTSTICNNGQIWNWNGSSFYSSGSCTSTTTTNHSSWNGCVTDRDQNYDTTNTTPSSGGTLFPAEQYSLCPVQLMPLSYDWTALNSKIDAMTPNGNTNQAIGLAWGWQSLTSGAPLNAPAEDPNYQYQRIIILLTDGLNTQDRWYTSQTSIDNRQRTLCDNIKAANPAVTIYTVQVNTGGDATSSLLQYCASDASKFFLLTSADQIVTTFNQIGTNLSKLRLAR